MDAQTKVLYTDMKRKAQKHKRSLFLRFGIALISMLTFYVLLTFYNQLRHASQILMEIKKRDIVLNTSNTHALKSTKNTKADSAKSVNGNEFDNNIFSQIFDFAKSQNDSEFSEDDLGQAIRRRFQENVYMIRKRFYESHQSANAMPAHRVIKSSAGRLPKISSKKSHISDSENLDVLSETREESPKFSRGPRGKNLQISRGNHAEERNTDSEIDWKGPRAPRETRVESSVPGGTRAKIMIVAYHRSGSSFLGEMFNQDPKAFYLFEPIHTIDSFLDARRRFPILYDTLIRNLLDTIFKCDFSKHPLFVNTLTASPFRLKSVVLTSEGLCDPRVTSHKMHLCRRINATFLTKLCSARPYTAIKTIRMAHWENLDFLGENSPRRSNSFRVIHLVRDPRGIIASRLSWLLERYKPHGNVTTPAKTAVRSVVTKYVRMISKSLCKQMKDDINNWTKRAKFGPNFALIRYEDVARKPLIAYQQISEFAGVAQSKHVIGWLENNTKRTSDLNYYSTTRNSSAVPHMWRRKLTMPLVHEIQTNCAEVMGILGYKMAPSETELKDMSESLVINWDNRGLLKTKTYIDNS